MACRRGVQLRQTDRVHALRVMEVHLNYLLWQGEWLALPGGRAFWKAHRASVPNWYSASIISSFAAVLLIHNASLNDQD